MFILGTFLILLLIPVAVRLIGLVFDVAVNLIWIPYQLIRKAF